jgi:hypothetical protein
VSEGFVTDTTVVTGKLEHNVELGEQRDDEFSAPLLLV